MGDLAYSARCGQDHSFRNVKSKAGGSAALHLIPFRFNDCVSTSGLATGEAL